MAYLSSYSYTIITMAISCIVSQIKRDIDQKSRFLPPPFYTIRHWRKKFVNIFSLFFFTTELDPWAMRWLNRFCRNSSVYSQFPRITDKQTNRQTDRQKAFSIVKRNMYYVTLAKNNSISHRPDKSRSIPHNLVSFTVQDRRFNSSTLYRFGFFL